MKKIFFPLLILMTIKGIAQNKDYLVSMDGIGPFKIDMTQEDLEKLLQKKIPLTNPLDTSGAWYDSATIKYKNMEVRIDFERTYTDNKNFYMRITGMRTSSPLCKTKSGIGIGSTKQQIIAAYENNMLIMQPDFEEDGYSKTKYLVTVRDTEVRRMIVFHLTNKKVVSFEAVTYFTDSE